MIWFELNLEERATRVSSGDLQEGYDWLARLEIALSFLGDGIVPSFREVLVRDRI